MILIAHNYAHVLDSCDRINLLESGRIVLDKPAAETSVEELTHIIVEEYRQARLGTPSELALA
jgi:ABC-type sugar transport system ATPase subunit